MARQMKDSGIEWIGEIPATWDISRVKYVAEFEPSCDTSHLSENSVITYTPMDCIKNGWFINNTTLVGNVSSSLTPFHNGDIVMAKVTPCFENGNIAIMENLASGYGLGSSELFVFRPVDIDTRYFFYWLQNPMFVQLACSTMTGTGGLKRVSPYFAKNCYVHYPPFAEQKRIADFLDHRCAEIDAVIKRTKATIEEYKKLKQAVITEAVTKGVRGPRKMQDSGIEWIGEIPEGWSVPKFGYVAEVKSNLVAPELYPNHAQISPENIEKGSGRLLSYGTVADVGVISGNHLFYEGQILYSKIRPKLNKVCIAPFEGLCSADMYPIETHHLTRFVMYCMLSDVFLSQVAMVTEERVKMPKINQVELARIRVVMPDSVDEETEIAAYLDEKCTALDTIIAKKTALLNELETYKKSLIYEYVTGKKSVE